MRSLNLRVYRELLTCVEKYGPWALVMFEKGLWEVGRKYSIPELYLKDKLEKLVASPSKDIVHIIFNILQYNEHLTERELNWAIRSVINQTSFKRSWANLDKLELLGIENFVVHPNFDEIAKNRHIVELILDKNRVKGSTLVYADSSIQYKKRVNLSNSYLSYEASFGKANWILVESRNDDDRDLYLYTKELDFDSSALRRITDARRTNVLRLMKKVGK